MNKESRCDKIKEQVIVNSSGYGRKHQRILEKIQTFRLMDDDLMTKIFEDVECAELLLQIIMEKPDLRVVEVHTQYFIKNLQGRSVRLDIRAFDSSSREYNVEVEKERKKAHVKRARYNSSIMDANITNPGDQYELLSETYVIFITDFDMFGDGLPVYHIDRTIQENGRLFQDESHIIYVNGLIKDQTPLGRLMHDFSCADPDDMNYKVLADRVRYFKQDKEGIVGVESIIDEIYEEMKAQYGEEVKAQVKRELQVQLEENVKMELKKDLRAQVKRELKAQLEDELKVQLEDELKAQLEDELKAQLKKEASTQTAEIIALRMLEEGVKPESVAKCVPLSIDQIIKINYNRNK